MRYTLLAVLPALCATPAAAQQMDPNMPGMKMPGMTHGPATPQPVKPPPKTPAAPASIAPTPSAEADQDGHAGHETNPTAVPAPPPADADPQHAGPATRHRSSGGPVL